MNIISTYIMAILAGLFAYIAGTLIEHNHLGLAGVMITTSVIELILFTLNINE